MNSAKMKREIIGLALLLDEVSDLAVFIRYSSHVKKISIDVRASKEDAETVFDGSFYFDFKYDDDRPNYHRIKAFLNEEIAKATEIPGGE